jgi:hypothetical protein
MNKIFVKTLLDGFAVTLQYYVLALESGFVGISTIQCKLSQDFQS